MLPNLIVIGAMKAGSTSLHVALSSHPDIYMSRVKELHFFSNNWNNGLKWYEDQFDAYNGERRIGESSASYTKNGNPVQVATRIAQTLPDAKILYIVRDPIKRMISQYHHLLAGGLRMSFIDCLKLDRLFTPEGRPLGIQDLVINSCYYQRLIPFLDNYDRSQIKIIIFERFINNFHHVCSDIFKFLDVDASYKIKPLNKAYNSSKEKFDRLLQDGNDIGNYANDLIEIPGEEIDKIFELIRNDCIKLEGLIGERIDCWDIESSIRENFRVS